MDEAEYSVLFSTRAATALRLLCWARAKTHPPAATISDHPITTTIATRRARVNCAQSFGRPVPFNGVSENPRRPLSVGGYGPFCFELLVLGDAGCGLRLGLDHQG